MGWLNNLKVAQRLVLLILVFVVALVGVGGTGYLYLKKTSDSMDAMYREKMHAVELILDNRIHMRRIEMSTFELMITTDDSENQKLLTMIREREAAFDKNVAEFEKMPLTSQQKAEVEGLRTKLQAYRQVHKQVLTLAGQNKNAEAYQLFKTQAEPLGLSFNQVLVQLSEDVKKEAAAMNEQGKKDFSQASLTFTMILAVSIVLGLALGWTITKRITSRLSATVVFLDHVAEGDFSQEVPTASMADRSEFGALATSVDKMNRSIGALIRNLLNTAEQLAASSEELTASADQSAQASNQVAQSITEVAKGSDEQLRAAEQARDMVEQMSKGIDQVAQNTMVVSASAQKTAGAAAEGEQSVGQAVAQMGIIETKTEATAEVIASLEERSKQIGQIVEVISTIAAQTNLLALNAAIEAARAGEAGRGFAVVADEVRKLAEQSQDAAKQITELIGEVQGRTNQAVLFMNEGRREVETGAKVVNSAGQSFADILRMVREISAEVHEISAATEELTSGTQQVVDAAQRISKESRQAAEQTETISAATEEQSASMEEIASASRHLANMAEGLQVAVQKFKI
ncbi:methyl-accepting chemotaxis protein [Anaeroarcus burkinensis]|uniref:methyl-accepting chemotaxis protein n=1 Tax=Anaeroarcus burkinensis TaxID=82376 RepID=UPI00040C1D8F|nr:methyl-accepting chemotaxis protein [Anaeroarcus burkinensis]